MSGSPAGSDQYPIPRQDLQEATHSLYPDLGSAIGVRIGHAAYPVGDTPVKEECSRRMGHKLRTSVRGEFSGYAESGEYAPERPEAPFVCSTMGQFENLSTITRYFLPL